MARHNKTSRWQCMTAGRFKCTSRTCSSLCGKPTTASWTQRRFKIHEPISVRKNCPSPKTSKTRENSRTAEDMSQKYSRVHRPQPLLFDSSHQDAEVHRRQCRDGKLRNGRLRKGAKAYLHAHSTSTLFEELCEKDRRPEDELMCGELYSVDAGQKIRRDKLAKMLCRLTVQLRIPGGSWERRSSGITT